MTTTTVSPEAAFGGQPAVYREAVDAFAQIATVLTSEVTLDSFLHLICDKACALLDIAHVSLYLRDAKGGQFQGQVARYEYDVDDIIKSYVAGVAADGFTREILETRQPVLIKDAQSDPRPVRAQMRRWNVDAIFGVPMIAGDDLIGLLYFDNGGEAYPFSRTQQEMAQVFANFAASAIVQATGRSRLQASLTSISRQNKVLRHLSTINDQLTSVVLRSGTDLSDIAAAIAELARNPCVIHDASRARLAESRIGGDPVISPLDGPAASRPAIASQLRLLSTAKPVTVGPCPGLGLPRRCIVAAVELGNEHAAYLVIEDRSGAMGTLESAIAQRATSVIALELVAARRGRDAELDTSRTLVAELVRGARPDPVLEERAKRLGFDLRSRHAVVVVSARGDGEPLPAAQEIAEALAATKNLPAHGRPTVLATEFERAATLIVRLPEGRHGSPESLKEPLGLAINALTHDGELLAGISSACIGPECYGRAHFECTQILGLLRNHTRPAEAGLTAVSSDELGASRLLLASHGPAQLDAFLHDVLGDLANADDPKMTALLETVSLYLSNGSSTGKTAAGLGIHENSVRNRLTRASALTGMDIVSDGDARLQMQLAIHGLHLRRQLAGGERLRAV